MESEFANSSSPNHGHYWFSSTSDGDVNDYMTDKVVASRAFSTNTKLSMTMNINLCMNHNAPCISSVWCEAFLKEWLDQSHAPRV